MHLRGLATVCCSLLLLLRLLVSTPPIKAEPLPTLHIGALVAVNSSIGRVALGALQLAVQDVNANASILPGYKLELQTVDSMCDAFHGADAVVHLLNTDVMAIAGPQTSVLAQFAADLGEAMQVPFVSYSATDSSLTTTRNPYFVRTLHNDRIAMDAIAALVGLYGWRTVAGVSTDDFVGLNSLSALSEGLVPFGSCLQAKSLLQPRANRSDIAMVLNNLAQLETRVFIVHLQPDLGRLFFATAHALSMMTSGFVWIVSESLAGALDNLPGNDPLWGATQGVIGVCSYIPPSAELNSFRQRWNVLLKNSTSLSSYGMYAYDSIWMIALAMDRFLAAGKTFELAAPTTKESCCQGFGSLRRRLNGEAFLETLKSTQFVGLSGPIVLNSQGDLADIHYEVMNLIGKSARVVGYWSDGLGFSVEAPVPGSPTQPNISPPPKQPAKVVHTPVYKVDIQNKLQDVIWPGGSAEIPKGWTVAKNGQTLLIGVPHKEGFQQFVHVQKDPSNITTFDGFCIQVFREAVSNLPYPLNYTFVAFGNGTVTPSYDDLIQNLVDNVYDGVVGDVTILEGRSEEVDFTQPFISSGLVVLVPLHSPGSNHPWAFMRPFTPLMWVTTGLFFLVTGLAVWILEHKKNRQFRGKPKKQFVTVLWFTFSTLFFAHREDTKSTLGRAVLVIWLFVVLIINSSYTASLTTILTVQQLQPTIQGIAGLVASNLAIGYQEGSFVEKYLLRLNVAKERLHALSDESAFADALRRRVVGAVVDELPYVEMFLQTECDYTIAGQEFTKSGWGFAFPKGSQLATDMSTAILGLADSGDLQKIHDFWLKGQKCGTGIETTSNELGLGSFWGLFLITGTASIFCVIFYYTRLILQHHRAYRDDDAESEQSMSRSSHRKSFLRSLVTYIEESEVAARDDALGVNSLRKPRVPRRSCDYGLEAGGSARSEDPVLAATTPDHPATRTNTY